MIPALELCGLTKSFGTKSVLKGVDLCLYPQESLVVLGGSGSGKSVLLKCILGLLKRDGGLLKVGGKEVRLHSEQDQQDLRAQVGMLFQGGALFDSLCVWENIVFGLRQRKKISNSEARDIALEKLNAVGLGEEVLDLSTAELSGGMQKRVALARAIAGNPRLLFFDEPTTGLDPIMRSVIDNLIVTCVKTLGASAITITHDLISARAIADRLAFLYDGKILWTGPSEQLEEDQNPYVDQFVHGRLTGPIPLIGSTP